jgi:DNA replication protein DnaC
MIGLVDTERQPMQESRIGYGVKYKDCSLDNYRADTDLQKQVVSELRGYAGDPKSSSIVLTGTVGTGKTHLAIGAVKEFCKTRPELSHWESDMDSRDIKKTVIFTGTCDVIDRIKKTWSGNSDETESAIVYRHAHCAFLILDDIGVQFGSDAEKLLLYKIINKRYDSMLPTIVTSNLGISALENCVGQRIVSRLSDNGVLIILDQEDKRGFKKILQSPKK